MVPSTLRSGTAPLGRSPVSVTSTVRVPLLHRRIDARDAPFDDAVARVDFRLLTELDVLGLRFRDLDFRLQPARVRDAGEVRARGDLLADFDRHQLQHAVEAGADFQLVAAAAASAAAAREPDRPADCCTASCARIESALLAS